MASMSRYNYFGATTVMENLLKRRWSAAILRRFEAGITSPDEICNLEPELTPPVMNERLRTMLRYNLIARSPIRAPARVLNYKLTPRGQRILKMLTLIEQFDQVEELVIQSTATGRIVVRASLNDNGVAPTVALHPPASAAALP